MTVSVFDHGENTTRSLRSISAPGTSHNHPSILSECAALITAGGMGTRLLPFSKEMPKEMFPMITLDGNGQPELKPLVQVVFEQLHKAGVRRFYIVVGRGKRVIEDHFNPDLRFQDFLERRGKVPRGLISFYDKIRSSSIVFLNQPEPLGFGDAVRLGRRFIRGSFLVQAADTFILSEGDRYLDRLAAMHHKYHSAATVLLEEVPDPRRYGVVEGNFLEEGVFRVTSAVEKPRVPRTNRAITAVYMFTDRIFDSLSVTQPARGGEVQLTDAIQRLIASGNPVIGVMLGKDERRLDLGTPETIIEATKTLLRYIDFKTVKDSAVVAPSWIFAQSGQAGLVSGAAG